MDRAKTGDHGFGRAALGLAAAASAAVHAELVPEHLREEPSLGVAFLVAAVLLCVCAAALLLRPLDPWPPRALALVLAGLLAGYALTRLAAVPLVGWEREPLDLLGLGTKLVEAAGLFLAIRLARRPGGGRPLSLTVSPGGAR
jgi:hypothetical protein